MTTDNSIITKKENPFIRLSWINQGYPFTLKRQQQFLKLINKNSIDISLQNPANENKYVAFIIVLS